MSYGCTNNRELASKTEC